MTQHTPEVEEIGAFPDDPTGLKREFAIKFHRGDFLKNGEKFDNSELITDWWLEKITTITAKHEAEKEKAVEAERTRLFEEMTEFSFQTLPYEGTLLRAFINYYVPPTKTDKTTEV